MATTSPPPISDRFWFFHLLFWLCYLLLKFTHMAIMLPLQDNEASWPFLFSYSGVVLLNILLTGWLAWRLQHYQGRISHLMRWLLLWLLPWSVLMVWLRFELLQFWQLPDGYDDRAMTMFKTYLLVALPLAGWLAGFLLYQSNLRYQQQAQLEQQLLSQARAARLKILRYQLDPHFMFNTLNALNALIVSRQDQQIEQLIEQLSVFLRHSLQERQDQVPLQQELNALHAYLAIQQYRFGARLQLDWQLPQLPPLQLPPLLLQPLAEYAIASSVTEQTGPVRLQLTLCYQPPVLHLSLGCGPVADFAPLAALMAIPAADWPEPLRQLNERLQLLFGDISQLQLNRKQGYLQSRFCLPLEALDVRTNSRDC